jgi:putative protein-disulfide isomerase
MSKTLQYVYDPLCGWCYGAMPALAQLRDATGIRLELLPTGLFAGHGARAMDDDFAAFAWSNDQRIATQTGQTFSEAYRRLVLADRQQRFDSGPATLALSAVAATAPAREYDALKAIQLARYVEGRDVTSVASLVDILHALGLSEAAALLVHPEPALVDLNKVRTRQAQALLQAFAARGVPTLILDSAGQRSVLNSSALFANPATLIEQLVAV